MPLRRWFTGHGMPGWYSWLVVVGLTVTSMGLALAVNITLTNRAISAERSARLSNEQQSEQARRATCLVVIAQDDAFTNPPPATPAGRKAAAAWHYLRMTLRCDHQ
jgi:hypothetical protein